jgi:intracellular sulfur oxidation DsrE/DsrF family protein
MNERKEPVARRTFMTLIGLGAFGAGSAQAAPSGVSPAKTAAGPVIWRPALEPQDDWLELPGRHRLVLDATSALGAGDALGYAGTYLHANQHDYKLEAADLAVVIVLRHLATPFAFKDPAWAKYGPQFAKMLKFTDPKTDKPPVANLYDVAGYNELLSNRGTTLASLTKQGVNFAVCGAATQAMSAMIAKTTQGDADTIRAELISSLIPNAHMAAAGIVAVNRAQERGYALAYAG